MENKLPRLPPWKAEVLGQMAEGLDRPFPFKLVGFKAPAKPKVSAHAAKAFVRLVVGSGGQRFEVSSKLRPQNSPLYRSFCLLPSAFVQ